MKKFLSAFLAILMVLTMVATSMVTAFAAEEAEEVHSILISNGEDIAADQTKDVKSHGWRNHNGHEFTMMELDGQKAAAITVKSNASSTTPRFHYYSDTTVDLTKFTYVEFDFYISDLAKMTDGFKPGIELSSAGLQDKAEVAGDVTGVEWKAGWNHVKVALADIKNATPGDAGAFDPTAWNFMRVLVGGTGTFKASESDPLILAIDNFGFSDGTETPAEKVEPETPANPQVPSAGLAEIVVWDGAKTEIKVGKSAGVDGWHEGLKITEIGEDKRLAAAVTLTGNDNHAASMVYMYNAATPIDISAMTHVEFDFYISDVTKLNSNSFNLELTSSGTCDKEEIACDVKKTFVNGWNHIKVDFTSNMVSTGGTLDPTQFDFFRFFTTANLACGDGELVVAVDDLKFTNADYDAQSVPVSLVESLKPAGWGWKGNVSIKHNGNASVSTTLAANKEYGGGAGAFNANFSYDGALDTTGATKLHFWLYTDDAAVMKNVEVEFEITSGGTCDVEESAYMGTLDRFVEGGIQDGWNEVVIPLSALDRKTGGNTDWAKIDFFRMYNSKGFKTGENGMILALDQMEFLDDADARVAMLTRCDVETYWDASSAPMELDGELVIGATWAAGAKLGVGGFMLRYGEHAAGKIAPAADISGMKYLEFDFYVSDAAALNAAGFSFELTSVGGSDKEENAHNWEGNWKNGIANGWNHIQMPLSWFTPSVGNLNSTAWNFIRLFNSKDLQVGENGLTVALKNIEFTTGKYGMELDADGNPTTEKEVITFTPSQADKKDTANSANKDLVVKITSGDNAEKFFADGNGEIIYKIPVAAAKYVQSVTLGMTTGAQLLLQASTDGETWTEIYRYRNSHLEATPNTNGGLEKAYYTYDLTDALVGEKGLTGDYIYIRIADSYPQAGWGGNLYYTPVTLEIIRTPVPHDIKLPEYGTKLEGWNWGSSLNHAQGSFSASNTFKAGQTLGNANILVLYQSKDGKGVDASTADSFEFDLFVSNAAALKDTNVELELTSSGAPDDREKRFVNASLSTLIEGGMKDGWNHVVLPLSKMGDHDPNAPIDWTNVNCFRQYYFAGVNTGDADLVVAYDNLIFTKEGKTVATLSTAEPDTNGWDAPAMDMDGKLAIGATSKGKFDVCAIYVNYVSEKDIDVTGMKYLEYDLYISNVDPIKNVTLYTEINSSGDFDKNELGYDKTFAAHGLKSGWNRIKIELSKMGDTAGQGACDLAAIKWFRIFTVDVVDGIDEITYAVANVRFTDDQAPEIELPENPEPETPAIPAPDSELSVKDAIALGGSMEHDVYTEGKYYVTGVITEVYNTKYGNMKITDAEGNILTIYGTWSADGSTRYDALETKPVAGDTVTLYGIVGQYNGTPQIKNGWITAHTAAGDEPQPATKEDKYIFEMFTDEEKKYLDPDFQANVANNEVRFADCSAYFIYKYDLKSFRGVQSISFEGNIGGQLHLWASADGKNWVEIEKHETRFDAKYMNIDLSVMAEAVAQTMTLYVKIGDAVTADGNGGQIRKGQVHLTVVYDATADQTPLPPPEVTTEHEKYEFTIGTDEEGKYLLNEGGSVLKTPDHDRRYADTTKYFIYKYDVKNVHQIAAITFKAKAEAQMMLQVSVDKENWITIDLSAHGVKNVGDRLSTAVYKFDITAIAEKLDDAHKTIYVKISDNKTDDGWGGCLVTDTPVVLDIEYTPLTNEQKDEIEATRTEHSIPLWGANKTWGGKWTTDEENQLAGSGCISINLKGVTGTEAPSKKFDAVDATGMDTLEFDIYISDLKVLEHLKNNTSSGSIELCSGGSCDKGEKAIGIPSLVDYLERNNVQVGWNHCAFEVEPLPGTPGDYGPFTLANIDYIRFFWTDMTDCGEDLIMKLDNFRMTDAKAQADKAAAEFEAKVLEDNAGLIANMEALKTVYEGELNADNFASAKAKYSNTKAAFEKLSAEAQEILKAKGYYQHISKAKKAIEDYEEVQQILKDNAKLIADLEALVAYKDASAFTNENYDAAKAAIEAARAAVDALTKTQKDALATYIAHLTAAEDAMPDTKPPKAPCTEHVDADKDGKCDECGAEVTVEPTDCEHVDADGDKKCDKCGEDMGGCKSALTIGALATMILAGAWVTIAARKKED